MERPAWRSRDGESRDGDAAAACGPDGGRAMEQAVGRIQRIWSRIGTAWLNRDGSINLVLDSIPLGGRINIREDDRERRTETRGALAVAAETPQDAG
jgi:hypothetical protein